MKKTEEEIIQVALNEYSDSIYPFNDKVDAFVLGAKWMQEQGNEWIEFKNVDKNKLNNCPSNLIMCKFDNGDILRFDEEHNFALLTHILFIPEPPKR